MIEAKLARRENGFVARLTAKARALAETAAENRLRARASDPWRWRKPGLLWPLFLKD